MRYCEGTKRMLCYPSRARVARSLSRCNDKFICCAYLTSAARFAMCALGGKITTAWLVVCGALGGKCFHGPALWWGICVLWDESYHNIGGVVCGFSGKSHKGPGSWFVPSEAKSYRSPSLWFAVCAFGGKSYHGPARWCMVWAFGGSFTTGLG